MTDIERPAGPEYDHNAPQIFGDYVTEAEYARQRGVSVRTCQRDRALRNAPPHIVLGKTVYYRVAAIRQWLVAQECKPTGWRQKSRPNRSR